MPDGILIIETDEGAVMALVVDGEVVALAVAGCPAGTVEAAVTEAASRAAHPSAAAVDTDLDLFARWLDGVTPQDFAQ